MRKNSLVNKLIFIFSGILAVILILFAIGITIWLKGYFIEQQQQEFSKQVDIITSSAKDYLEQQNYDDLDKLNNTLQLVGTSANAQILAVDRNGFAYANSDENSSDTLMKNIGITDSDMETLKNGQSVIGAKITDLPKGKLADLYPIIYSDTFNGTIVMISSTDNITNAMSNAYKIIWACVFIAVIASSLITSFAVKKLVINRLDEINNAAKKLAKGDVQKRVEIKSRDEIGELGDSFNIMADSLEKVDKNRRDFVSNVSHELRSPITSIKGFISGILDGVIPKDKENYYLNIVYDEINRLTRLVTDLLDISAMEAGKFKLNISEIDINELIRLCLANLEGKIASKDLTVDVVLVNKHQFVKGDMDRIIQVITNLIDNAIKYTENNGQIKIDAKLKADKVYVSIFNSGSHMTEEQIIRIWDRFYKSDKSRTNKESTGLGLPIVRLILTQHGEDIWVKNVRDGVEFTFTLTTV